jgi:DNA-binding NtrC family response regulator
LQHVLEYCFVFAKGYFITERHLPQLESSWIPKWDVDGPPLQTMERTAIVKALEATYGNKQEAANMLKISRSKLWRKIKAHKITEADFKSERSTQF